MTEPAISDTHSSTSTVDSGAPGDRLVTIAAPSTRLPGSTTAPRNSPETEGTGGETAPNNATQIQAPLVPGLTGTVALETKQRTSALLTSLDQSQLAVEQIPPPELAPIPESDLQPNASARDQLAVAETSNLNRVITVRRPLSADKNTPSESGVEPVGTSAAQQELSMKKTGKMLKIAELDQQNLPGDPAEKAVKQAASETSAPMATPDHSALPNFTAASAATSATDATTISSTAVAGESVRPTTLQQTCDLVALQAVRFRESNVDSVRVVIEPGGGIHLSLELRWRNNVIEAQATLQSGDFHHLNRHWSELQQKLEPRGVHLTPLLGMDESGSKQRSSHRHSSQPQPRGEPEPMSEFGSGGPMTESPKTRRTRAKHHPGWETWA